MAVKKGTSAKKAVPARKTVPAAKGTTKAVAPKRTAARAAAKSATPAARGVPRTTSKASSTAAPLRAQKSSARASTAQPRPLLVREDETPWTAKELKAVRAELEADVVRLLHEISVAESELAGLMRDAGDGSGDDQADAGTKTFEREQEISLANNARVMFEQSEHALQRIDDRSYGICENCGNPIGKNRLLAFPRATLCMPCKSKQERR
jgi:RNA polymerase-binding protein DksA